MHCGASPGPPPAPPRAPPRRVPRDRRHPGSRTAGAYGRPLYGVSSGGRRPRMASCPGSAPARRPTPVRHPHRLTALRHRRDKCPVACVVWHTVPTARPEPNLRVRSCRQADRAESHRVFVEIHELRHSCRRCGNRIGEARGAKGARAAIGRMSDPEVDVSQRTLHPNRLRRYLNPTERQGNRIWNCLDRPPARRRPLLTGRRNIPVRPPNEPPRPPRRQVLVARTVARSVTRSRLVLAPWRLGVSPSGQCELRTMRLSNCDCSGPTGPWSREVRSLVTRHQPRRTAEPTELRCDDAHEDPTPANPRRRPHPLSPRPPRSIFYLPSREPSELQARSGDPRETQPAFSRTVRMKPAIAGAQPESPNVSLIIIV
jgi:hypothetical protein